MTPHTALIALARMQRSMQTMRDVKGFRITGENTFCKRIRYQSTAEADLKFIDGCDNFEDLLDLASAPHRWSTKAKAMSALCSKITKVMKMIDKWAGDPNPNHKDRKSWAKSGLQR